MVFQDFNVMVNLHPKWYGYSQFLGKSCIYFGEW